MIAALAVHLDPSLVPGFFVGCAAAASLYVAARTLSRRCPLPHFAGLCALAVVLVPDTFEVFLNVVNLQWLLAVGLILLLISRDPQEKGEWVHDLIASAAMGLTGPFCIFLSPLFVWRALHRRTIASAALLVVIVACALVQTHFVRQELAASPSAPVSMASDAELLRSMVGCRIGGSLFLGALLPIDAPPVAWTALGIATLGLVGFLAFRPGPNRGERAMLGLAYAVFLAASSVRTYSTAARYFIPHSHSRYVFVPQLLTVFLLLMAAVQNGRSARIFAWALAWCLLVNIPRLREPAYADMQWSLYAPRIRAGEPVTVPINPPGWTMKLPEHKGAP
jgi:hypothetical protein